MDKPYVLRALLPIILLCCLSVQAAPQDSTPQPQAEQEKTVLKPGVTACPLPGQLQNKGLWWGAPNGWRSYSASFVKEISHFVGVQWIGIEVGKAICIYKGVEENTFPVAIERSTLIPAPATGENWSKDLGGYKACHSTNVMDCPLPPKAEAKKEDVYEVLEGFKKKE